MISIVEMRAALDGSWLLLRNRPEGMNYFDQSIQGFWRSFFVVLLLIPVVSLSGLVEQQLYFLENMYHPDAFPSEPFWIAKFLGLGVDWVALPLFLALIAVPLGLSQRFIPFVVTRNWTSLLASLPYLVVYLLFLLGVISPALLGFCSLATTGAVIWYRYQVTRIALQTTTSVSIAVVVLDVLLALIAAQVTGMMWQ